MLIIKPCKSYRKRLLGLAYDFVRIPRLPPCTVFHHDRHITTYFADLLWKRVHPDSGEAGHSKLSSLMTEVAMGGISGVTLRLVADRNKDAEIQIKPVSWRTISPSGFQPNGKL